MRYRRKLALELISLLEQGPKGNGNASTWKKTIERLNQQHNQIRSWQAGSCKPAITAATAMNGFRLLP